MVIVGAVEVDESIAELFEDGEGGWGAVDELAISACGRKSAFDNERGIFAGLDSLGFEFGVDCLGIGESEDGFDRATFCA